MNVNELLAYAIKEIEEIEDTEIFLVKDLFKGYVWRRIEIKDRLLLGTLFLNYIHKQTSLVIPIEKTSSGQQKYKKLC